MVRNVTNGRYKNSINDLRNVANGRYKIVRGSSDGKEFGYW